MSFATLRAITIAILLLCAYTNKVVAQIPEAPVSIQSPNAASFKTYTDIPVSYYSGKPDIAVDLFSVADGSIKIPISLYYDASGVKPDQHGGWTGLN